jgi:oligopeptide/dipeptide ABC transporter ATP-binding protein
METRSPVLLLEVVDLSVQFDLPEGVLHAVDHLDFSLSQGECLGIVGESGSGKSVTCLSLLGLIEPPGKVSAQAINFLGKNLLHLSNQEWRQIRGNQISIVFQDPMTTLNPLFRVGQQVYDVLEAHQKEDSRQLRNEAIKAMQQAGIPEPEQRFNAYPFELSGGLRQRVSIAMAISNHPNLLIADEPTTALDVSVQAQVLNLFHSLKELHQFAIIFVTHDLDVVASIADTIMVMYAGQCVEKGPMVEILNRPHHPYTAALLRSAPTLNSNRSQKLRTIEGTLPSLIHLPGGCRFNPRCERKVNPCTQMEPDLKALIREDHQVRCFNPLINRVERCKNE